MESVHPYPAIQFPESFFLPGKGLSREIVEMNLSWIIDISSQRVDVLVSYFKVALSANYEQILAELGEKIATVLQTDAFSYVGDDKRDLTEGGQALAFDIAILLSHFLLEQCPDVRWSVFDEHSEQKFNPPILRGFWKEDLSIITTTQHEMRRLLWGHVGADIWASIYSKWRKSGEKAIDEGSDESSDADSLPEYSPEFMDTIFHVLERGIDTLADGESLIPFLIWSAGGELRILFFEGDTFEKGVERARAAAASLMQDAEHFVIGYDGFFTYDDVRYDAVIAEGMENSTGQGWRFVQRYRAAEENKPLETIGDPAFVDLLSVEEITS